MRKIKFIGMILALFMVAVLVGGCATTGDQPMTEQDYYDEAVGWWLDTEQNFKLIYLTKTRDEQREYLPFLRLLHQSKGVLDMWELKIQGGQPADVQIDHWKSYKNDLIMMFYNNYKEKKDGG